MIVFADDPESGILFDAESHTYTINGTDYLSTTTALKVGGLVDDRWFTEAARERGTLVHEALAADALGMLDEPMFRRAYPGLGGYLDSARQWMTEAGFVREATEVRAADTTRKTAGTMDHIGWISTRGRSRRVVVDWKTGDLQWYHRLQLAEYVRYAKTRDPGAVWEARIVRLYPDRIGHAVDLAGPELRQHEAEFAATLTVARMRIAHGLAAA